MLSGGGGHSHVDISREYQRKNMIDWHPVRPRKGTRGEVADFPNVPEQQLKNVESFNAGSKILEWSASR